MAWRDEFAAARVRWSLLTFYQKFEHGVITLLTILIALVIALAVWNLMLKVANSVIYSKFDPTDYEVFQALFGMIFTVIIALEFKRSLLIIAERKQHVVQVPHRPPRRTVDRRRHLGAVAWPICLRRTAD